MFVLLGCSNQEDELEQIVPPTWTQKEFSINYGGINRRYIIYKPKSYTENSPLLFMLHGFGSNMNNILAYSKMNDVADQNGFMICYPQGTTLVTGQAHWNANLQMSTVNDIDFLSFLALKIQEEYKTSKENIFSSGMSNGGFMSFLLACQLSEKIAAIASVTGSMTFDTYDNCNAQHPTPILQIHGTSDNIVPYNGNTGSLSIDDVISYWVNYNNCDTNPTITTFPDLDPSDGSTVEHIIYSGGDNASTIEHMKVIGGGHTWPGSVFNSPGTNQDINASMEIWQFFSRFDINGQLSFNEFDNRQVVIYPNPTSSKINLSLNFSDDLNYELFNATGNKLIFGTIKSSNQEIDLSNLPPNVYFLKLGNQVYKILKSN